MENERKIPAHVSIIMDGNGRWAAQRGKERTYGHVEGTKRVPEIVAECASQGIKYVSFYTFSEENWNRPKEEVKFLMELMWKSMHEKVDEMMRQGVRFLILGNRERLNPLLRTYVEEVEKMTASNTTVTAILFLSYSGQWDILQAAKKLAREAAGNPSVLSSLDDMQPSDFSKYLVTSGVPDPDLIIRTSGEQRISNYLLWQGAYSEFYFTDTLWPDFKEENLREALEEYYRRDRRYGKVK